MITEAIIDDVIERVEASYLGEAVMEDLRAAHPGIRFTYCMNEDITANAKPAKECNGFNIYYVDAREHCMCLTNNIEIAAGIVLAEVFEDDE